MQASYLLYQTVFMYNVACAHTGSQLEEDMSRIVGIVAITAVVAIAAVVVVRKRRSSDELTDVSAVPAD
jgi:cytochrome b